MPTEPETTTLVYVGPPGQESPTFGPLIPGESYQADEAFVAYLVTTHPDYWTRPSAPARAGGSD